MVEGTTQGDTLAMEFYGVSTTPIIQKLDHRITNVHQVWLADDATGAAPTQRMVGPCVYRRQQIWLSF